MFKARICAVAVSAFFVAATGGGVAVAAIGGDSNAGDIWVDTQGANPGPGHEMDPHLPCANIQLWGNGLADSSGTFIIDGWPPSGSQEQDYSGSWTYNTTQGGTQPIALIDFTQLIDTAASNGDKPSAQGYHFKIQFVQDPQKHKTFWVNCSGPPGPPPGGTTTGTSTTSTTSTTSGTTTTTGSTAPTAGVKGVTLKKHKRHHKKHSVKARRLSRKPKHAAIHAGFTG